MKRIALVLIMAVLTVALVLPVTAQDGATVVADDLRNPRQITFDADGNLYIAEAGVGGTELSIDSDGFGASARVTVITPDGDQDILLRGLMSHLPGQTRGLSAVQVTDESIWLLLGESPDWTIPFTIALVELDKETNRVKTYVDLLTIELEEDPDGNNNEQSNPVDFVVAEDGTIYIANAGCNCVETWNAEDGLSVFYAWDFANDNPVPTTVAIGPDGDLYVSFLTGFPFAQGSSRVERWTMDGELIETYAGLTAVTDVLVTEDGTIYAVEFGEEFNSGSGWSAGRVVMVSADGITSVMDGLNAPYGLAQNSDGTLFVSVGSIGADDGQVLVVE